MTSQQNYTLFLDTSLRRPRYEVFCKRCRESVGIVAPPAQIDNTSAASEGDREAGDVGLSIGAYLTAPKPEMLMNGHECLDYALELQGNLILSKPRKHIRPDRIHNGGGVRGKVSGFSKASRKRAMHALGKYDRAEVAQALFVTLTYPADYPDGRKAKRDWDVFVKRLRRKYPKVGLFWRMEPQKRGAPHFHALVFGVGFIPSQWIAHAWYEVCNTGDPKHLKAGTQIKRVESYKHAVYYVSKYITKVDQEELIGDDWGRLWGQLGQYQNYLYQVKRLRLNRRQFVRCLRFIDSYNRSYARKMNQYRVEHGKPRRKPYRARRDSKLYWSGSYYFDADLLHDNLFAIVGV